MKDREKQMISAMPEHVELIEELRKYFDNVATNCRKLQFKRVRNCDLDMIISGCGHGVSVATLEMPNFVYKLGYEAEILCNSHCDDRVDPSLYYYSVIRLKRFVISFDIIERIEK